uniref:Transposase n=1 Tax=Panagrellus redivivus TaxID=6233 RepID=A0A7E4W439_PANRE
MQAIKVVNRCRTSTPRNCPWPENELSNRSNLAKAHNRPDRLFDSTEKTAESRANTSKKAVTRGAAIALRVFWPSGLDFRNHRRLRNRLVVVEGWQSSQQAAQVLHRRMIVPKQHRRPKVTHRQAISLALIVGEIGSEDRHASDDATSQQEDSIKPKDRHRQVMRLVGWQSSQQAAQKAEGLALSDDSTVSLHRRRRSIRQSINGRTSDGQI